MSDSPFLEVLTRVYVARSEQHPEFLQRNFDSLKAQDSPDWVQTRLPDHVGVGVAASHLALSKAAPLLTGEYIWILDDDDECVRPSLVRELKVIAELNPDIIFLRMNHDHLGVLPDGDHWRAAPVHGHIGASAFVVKRQVWQRFAHVWETAVYHSDFLFISAVYEATNPLAMYWHNTVASKVQRVSYGRP